MKYEWLLEKIQDDILAFDDKLEVYALQNIKSKKYEDYYTDFNVIPNIIEQYINGLEAKPMAMGELLQLVQLQ